MADILLLLSCNALYLVGFYLCIQDGMLLDFITRYGSRLGRWFNPIGGCVTCMSSLHSWPYLYFYGFQVSYIIYVFALAAVGTAIYNRYFSE